MLLIRPLGANRRPFIEQGNQRYVKCKGVNDKSAYPCADLSIGSSRETDPPYKEGNGEDAQKHFQYTGNHGKHWFSHALNGTSYNEEGIHKDHHKPASWQKLTYKSDLLGTG